MPPWSREAGPLSIALKQGDLLKKKVDQVVKEATKLINNKKVIDRDVKLDQMYNNCIETKTMVQKQYNIIDKLKEDEEPSKIKDFDKKKTAELNRMILMKTQLTETMAKLLPGTDEAEYIKRHLPEVSDGKGNVEGEAKKDQSSKDEEDDDDEDETEDDEEVTDEEDDEEEASTTDQKAVSHMKTKKGEDKEAEEESKKDATVRQEKKKVKVDDAVDEAESDEDEDDDDEEDDDEEDDEEEDEDDSRSTVKNTEEREQKGKDEDDKEVTQSSQRFVAIQEYEGEMEGDLDFEKGDILTIIETREDGWWIAENEKGEQGLVPSTLLKIYNQYKNVQQDDEEEDEENEDEEHEDGESPRRSGRALWGGIKKAVNETTVSDVLHAMGAVPSGFRLSTLCRKFNEGDTYRMVNYLEPKLSKSNLAYRDLSFDPTTNKIRPRSARIERLITLVSCQQIPLPGAGIEVLDRHVRICLFDGQNILSNIHSVKVATVDRSARSWSFTTRVHDLMDPHMHGEIFVKTNNVSDNIGVLFELCISYKRVSTQERGEFSCGWVHLPLLENGTVIMNKSFDLYVHGGTIYEKGVEVDPSISRRTQQATSNALVSLISGNKQPRLLLKVQVPREIHKELMDTLPDTLMGNTCLLRLYSYYRLRLTDTLLRDRIDLDSTELIHDPLLREFPHAADTPDLMEFFTHEWIKRLREVKRDEKKDEEFMKELFQKVFMESVYLVSHLAMLPEYRMGDTECIQLRHESITKFAEMKKVGKTALSALLSADLSYEPFQMNEVAFNIIGPHCLSEQSVGTQS